MGESSGPPAAGIQAMNTVLYCRRFTDTVRFYDRVLALPRGASRDWFVEFRVAEGCFLSVADERRASVKSAGGAGLTLTLRVDDVGRFRETLRARGARPPPVGPRPWGTAGFLLHDPEGTRIEIWSPAG